MDNIFDTDSLEINKEIFETLLQGKNFTVERIISPFLPNGDAKWWHPKMDELVFLIQGTAEIEFKNKEIKKLKKGDYLFIKSGNDHRVAFTSENPLSIWLAIHYIDN